MESCWLLSSERNNHWLFHPRVSRQIVSLSLGSNLIISTGANGSTKQLQEQNVSTKAMLASIHPQLNQSQRRTDLLPDTRLRTRASAPSAAEKFCRTTRGPELNGPATLGLICNGDQEHLPKQTRLVQQLTTQSSEPSGELLLRSVSLILWLVKCCVVTVDLKTPWRTLLVTAVLTRRWTCRSHALPTLGTLTHRYDTSLLTPV